MKSSTSEEINPISKVCLSFKSDINHVGDRIIKNSLSLTLERSQIVTAPHRDNCVIHRRTQQF